MLRKCAYAHIVTTVVLLLWAIVSAASPAAASAKTTHLEKDQQSTDHATGVGESVVIAPGESLWLISARWLGPGATARQIAAGADRIYALNLERIGSDPNLVHAGQSLLLPAGLERRSPDPRGAAPARHAGEPTAPNPQPHSASNGADAVAGSAVGIADRRARQARGDARSEPASQPRLTRAVPVSAVRTLARNDSPPSPAQSVASEARSVFSTVVATAVEPFLPGSYPKRKVVGVALLAVSGVLALVLAVRVAQEVWGPSFARRRARERWITEALRGPHSSSRPRGAGFAYPAPSDFKAGPPANSPSEEANPAPAQSAFAGGAGGRLADGNTPSFDTRMVVRSRLARRRKARVPEAKGLARGHRGRAAGPLSAARGRRRPPTSLSRAQRTRALRRKGGRTMSGDHSEPRPTPEWKIGEPLRSALEAMPAQPGAPFRAALSAIKPLAADELRTVASLERRRGLSDNERRQACALQSFLATIEEVSSDA
jgi:hypothetical protein